MRFRISRINPWLVFLPYVRFTHRDRLFLTIQKVFLCVDINPHACRCTLATGKQNKVRCNTNRLQNLSPDHFKVPLECVQGSLTDPVSLRLKQSIDVLIFNPPYVPTDTSEVEDAQGHGDIQGSWAGGLDGMQVTEKLLERLDVRTRRLPHT